MRPMLTMMLALAATPVAAQQFDLVCEGTRQMQLNGPRTPYTYGFRVDLDARRWCWDRCERTYEIHEVAPDAIVFDRVSEDSRSRRETIENRVSRATGEHEQVWIQVRPVPTYMSVQGRCRREPFSGFPQALF